MKRSILILTLLALASFSAGCGNTVGKSGNVETAAVTTAAETTTGGEAAVQTEAVEAAADTPVSGATDDFDYEIADGHATISKYKGSSADVVVPAEIGGAPVTEIGFYSFEAKYNIKSVQLPDTITRICEGAFMDCSSLSSINLPDGLQEIERGAFVACTSIPELTIPASVTRIQEEAFTACEGMTTLTILSPDLVYESWGLEDLPQLWIYAPDGSAVEAWASEMGKLGY